MKKKELKQELKAVRLIARTHANSISQLLNEALDLKSRIAESSRMNSIYAEAEIEKYKEFKVLNNIINAQNKKIDTLGSANSGLLSQCRNRKLQVKELEARIKALEVIRDEAVNTTTLKNQVEEKDRVIGEINQQLFDAETQARETKAELINLQNKINEYEKVISDLRYDSNGNS